MKCQCQETLLVLHVCPIARKITPKNVNCRCTFKLKLLLAAGYVFRYSLYAQKLEKETKVMEGFVTFFGVKSKNFLRLSYLYTILSPNISTTPLRQWGFRQCLPFSWTTLGGKHCRNGSCRYVRALSD